MTNRILFDCERMKYENTGLFHYCLNLGNSISKLMVPQTEELTFYCPYGKSYLFSPANRFITQTELHKFWLPGLKNYQVWHATYQNSQYVPILNRQIRVALTIHDLNFMYDPSKPEKKKAKYLSALQKLVNRADAIICVSEFTKSDVLFYCDVKQTPVHVIHNGSNTLTEPQLLHQSYKPENPFIFSLGTILPKKNFHTLLPLLQHNPKMELVLAGNIADVGYYQSILDQAAKMGISARVKLVGPVTESEKSWYFTHCCAFALPSTAEGFGLPVTEAMSVGKPIFLSDKTALPEIGGDVAFYFESFQAGHMKDTFTAGMTAYKRYNMQEKIMEKGKKYCWENAAKKYLAIYRSLY